MSRKVNFEIEQGATFSQEIATLNTDGTAFDPDGWTPSGSIKKHYGAQVSFALDVHWGEAGSCVFSMSAANTALLEEGLYVYDIKISKDDTVIRLISGMVTVSPSVTE